jgi:hypothetical protein
MARTVPHNGESVNRKMENFMKNFCCKLKRLRGCVTLLEFSSKLGINLKTYQHYEAGTRKPNIKAILQIAVACNVSSDYLLGLSDDPHPTRGPPPMPARGLVAADPPGPAYAAPQAACPDCAIKQAQIDKLVDTLHNLSLGRSTPVRTSVSAPGKY